MPKRRESADIPIITEGTTVHIVYDPFAREYYNKRTDIYLCEDDISYHRLRPYSEIPASLPLITKEDPVGYFYNWKQDHLPIPLHHGRGEV
jgi:hypothetical protein